MRKFMTIAAAIAAFAAAPALAQDAGSIDVADSEDTATIAPHWTSTLRKLLARTSPP